MRLIDEPTGHVRTWLRIEGKPPAIPEERMAVLASWAKCREDARFKPSSLARSLADGVDIDQVLGADSSGQLATSSDALVPAPMRAAISLGVDALVDALAPRLVREVALGLPPPDDRLIGESEASARLNGVSPRRRIRSVRLAGETMWRESDVLRYIQKLGAKK